MFPSGSWLLTPGYFCYVRCSMFSPPSGSWLLTPGYFCYVRCSMFSPPSGSWLLAPDSWILLLRSTPPSCSPDPLLTSPAPSGAAPHPVHPVHPVQRTPGLIQTGRQVGRGRINTIDKTKAAKADTHLSQTNDQQLQSPWRRITNNLPPFRVFRGPTPLGGPRDLSGRTPAPDSWLLTPEYFPPIPSRSSCPSRPSTPQYFSCLPRFQPRIYLRNLRNPWSPMETVDKEKNPP